jgi:predicted PurR-regulated permease PerM
MNDTFTTGIRMERKIGGVALVALLVGCGLVLMPFVSAILWALILCIATWPVYTRLLRWLKQRRTLAAFIVSALLILVLLLPFVIVGMTLADNVTALKAAVKEWTDRTPPGPPAWLAKVPVIGPSASDYWVSMTTDTSKLWGQARKFIEPAGAGVLKLGLAIGRGLVHLAMSVFIAIFLFRDGTALVAIMNDSVNRIFGERGKRLLTVAVNTVRGVVYGIIGTALFQAMLAGIGFLVAGVPGATVLALFTFFSAVVPVVGTALVWLPAAGWLFYQGSTGWGVFMIVWGLIVANVDNVIKPLIIGQGSNMPFILILFGVLGGAMAFGFIGLFIGPTLLAVTYSVVKEWVSLSRVPSQELVDGASSKPDATVTPS